MNFKTRGLLDANIAVFLFGLVGVIGGYVTSSPLAITVLRVFFSSISLFISLLARKEKVLLNNKKDYLIFLLIGGILSFHWVMFMLAVQVGGVAIATITASTFPLFTSFLEPLIFKEKLEKKNIIMSIIILLGVFVLVPLDFKENIVKGILAGMLAASTYAILALFNRKLLETYSPVKVSFYQQFPVFFICLPIALASKTDFFINDLPYLAFLGVFCTALAHTLFISSLKNIKTHTAGIIYCLEPVYGIVLAMLILGEIPSPRTIIGGLIVITTTMYSSLKKDNVSD